MNTHPIEIEKFGSALGAKVLNIDLTVTQSDDVKKSLRTALDNHQIIFLDQDLTADSQKEATKIFGPLLSSETFLDHLILTISIMIRKLKWSSMIKIRGR